MEACHRSIQWRQADSVTKWFLSCNEREWSFYKLPVIKRAKYILLFPNCLICDLASAVDQSIFSPGSVSANSFAQIKLLTARAMPVYMDAYTLLECNVFLISSPSLLLSLLTTAKLSRASEVGTVKERCLYLLSTYCTPALPHVFYLIVNSKYTI